VARRLSSVRRVHPVSRGLDVCHVVRWSHQSGFESTSAFSIPSYHGLVTVLLAFNDDFGTTADLQLYQRGTNAHYSQHFPPPRSSVVFQKLQVGPKPVKLKHFGGSRNGSTILRQLPSSPREWKN
jgi:hypothetical protein